MKSTIPLRFAIIDGGECWKLDSGCWMREVRHRIQDDINNKIPLLLS